MKIAESSVKLIHCTPHPERIIERMGRICYQSNHKVETCCQCGGRGFGISVLSVPGAQVSCSRCEGTGTEIASAIAFVEMIKKNGHESVLEHAVAGFSIVTDRGVTHEIVRHRLASYSQESTRYCNYGKEGFGSEITVIEPPNLTPGENGSRAEWMAAMATTETIYLQILKDGCSPQIARSVLPNSLKTEIGMTANFREWRHFLRLRTSPKAHPQMRQIAEMIRSQLLAISRVCFDDIPEYASGPTTIRAV